MRRLFVVSAIMLAIYISFEEFRDYLNVNRKTTSIAAGQLASPLMQLPVRAPSSTENIKKSPTDIANEYLSGHKALWKIQPFHALHPVEFRTPLGTKVKYSVFQGEVPIVDMEIEIQLDRNLNVSNVQSNYRPLEMAAVKNPALSAEDIVNRNSDRYETEGEAKLTPPVLFARPGNATPELAYLVSVRDKSQASRSVQILFRASDGQVLSKSVSRAEF